MGAIARSALGHNGARYFKPQACFRESRGGDSSAVSKKAQQEVLSTYGITPELVCLVHGQFEHMLRP